MPERTNSSEKINLQGKLIIFVGIEGSGKTDNALTLSQQSGLPYIRTSLLIDEYAANDTGDLGEECRNMKVKNIYLSPDSMLAILEDRLQKDDVKNGLILDGGLRTLKETAEFQESLDKIGLKLPVVVVKLNLSEDISIERQLKRNSKKDTKEGIMSRLAEFKKDLEERISIMKTNPGWKYLEIDATPDFNVVYQSIKNALRQS